MDSQETDVVIVGEPDSLYQFENDPFKNEPEAKPEDLFVKPDFKPHWAEDVTDEQYHRDRTTVGSGQLRLFLDSPRAFYESYWGKGYEKDEDEPEPEHFRFGRIFHQASLEGSKFKENYIVMPDFGDMRTKLAREKKAQWLLEMPKDKIQVTRKDLDMILGMVDALMSHPQGADLLKNGRPECAGYYYDEETGIRLRIKPDFLTFNVSSLVDLKTARSSKKSRFMNEVYGDHRLDIQLYMYAKGVQQITGKWPDLLTHLVIEKKAPVYEPAIFYYDKSDFLQAESDYKRALRRMKNCIESGVWPYRQHMIEKAQIPQWFVFNNASEN